LDVVCYHSEDLVEYVTDRAGSFISNGIRNSCSDHLNSNNYGRPASHNGGSVSSGNGGHGISVIPSTHHYPAPPPPKHTLEAQFESLVQVVAAGFDATSEHIKYIDKDYKDGGVLILSKNEKRNIKTGMKNLNCTDNVKFRHMLAYQMEFGYDLSISPDDNVSSNPGFESVFGVMITG